MGTLKFTSYLLKGCANTSYLVFGKSYSSPEYVMSALMLARETTNQRLMEESYLSVSGKWVNTQYTGTSDKLCFETVIQI